MIEEEGHQKNIEFVSFYNMSNNYFERLSALARKLDKGIEELDDAWRLPQAFVGGYADITEETEARIESLKSSIQSTQDGVNELIRAKETSNLEVDASIKEAQVMYDILNEDVENLETVFKEFGYNYDKDGVDNSLGIKETEMTPNSNFSVEENSMEEIIFTPALSWRCKKNSIDKTSLNGNKHFSVKSGILQEMSDNILESEESKKAQQLNSTNYMIQSVSTPVSNIQLKSTMFNKSVTKGSVTHKQFLTPLRDRPRDQIYSKHFYNALKENLHQ